FLPGDDVIVPYLVEQCPHLGYCSNPGTRARMTDSDRSRRNSRDANLEYRTNCGLTRPREDALPPAGGEAAIQRIGPRRRQNRLEQEVTPELAKRSQRRKT